MNPENPAILSVYPTALSVLPFRLTDNSYRDQGDSLICRHSILFYLIFPNAALPPSAQSVAICITIKEVVKMI